MTAWRLDLLDPGVVTRFARERFESDRRDDLVIRTFPKGSARDLGYG